MSRMKNLMVGFAAFAALFFGAMTADAQYFAGKTITILIAYSPGGTSGTMTRVMAPYYAKYIPGKPTIIMKYMPGAGGLRAQNYLYEKAKPDGRTIGYWPIASHSQLLGAPGIRFDYAKFTVIGSVRTGPILLIARRDIVPGGLKEAEDIMKAKDLKLAGLRTTSWQDIFPRLALELLGVKFTYITGYRGGSRMVAAVRSGEANLTCRALGHWRSTVEPSIGGPKGIVKPVWYFPFNDEKGKFLKTPECGDMPTFLDVYKRVKGKEPSGQLWDALAFMLDHRSAQTMVFVGPPNMNKRAAADLRTGFEKMIRDPEAIAHQKKVFGFNLKPLPRQRSEKVFRDIHLADRKLVRFLKDYTTKYPRKR